MATKRDYTNVYCTGLNRHPIGMYGGPLTARRGTIVTVGTLPLICDKCGATCKASS